MTTKTDSGLRTIGLLASTASTLDSFFLDVVESWEAEGIRVVTAAGTPSQSMGLRHTVLSGVTRQPAAENLVGLRQLRNWVKNQQIDLVLTNTATSSALVRVAGVGAPVVYFCHGLHWDDESLRNLPMRWTERLLLRKTGGIICMNAADNEWFSQASPGTPRMRLEYGVGLQISRFVRQEPHLWQPGSRLMLVWCGEFSARKDPVAVVSLAHELLSRQVDFQIDMLGEGVLSNSADMKDSVGGRIRLHGRTDPIPFFQRANVLVQTSHWEGLPRVALEAVAMGRPTVGYDVKGVSDVPGAYLAKKRNASSLADAVLKAARRGAKDVPPATALTFEHCAEQVLRFCQDLVASENGPQ